MVEPVPVPKVVIPYLNPATVQAEITQFLPLIEMGAGLIPGATGTAIVQFLKAFPGNPQLVSEVCDAINDLDGAQPVFTQPALETAAPK